ncbi:MAG: glycosyltransferase [Nitrospirota bacterium]
MKISVIIPTLNAGRYLENLLSRLYDQDARPSEIVIIDSSSQDNTIDISRNFGVKSIIISNYNFNHGKTRNMAAIEAEGDVLVFMTQDALPVDNKLLGNLTEPLQAADIAATYGRQIPKSDASPLEVFLRHFNYPDSGMVKGLDDIQHYGIKTFFFSNVCSAIKKDLFLKSGMFPDVRANEDMIMAAKLILSGYKIAYVPDAVVIHSHNYSPFQQFRRYYNIGSSLKNNAWILKYARAEDEGIRFIKKQVRFLVVERKYLWIPYIFLDYVAKYSGYRIGLIAG